MRGPQSGSEEGFVNQPLPGMPKARKKKGGSRIARFDLVRSHYGVGTVVALAPAGQYVEFKYGEVKIRFFKNGEVKKVETRKLDPMSPRAGRK